jgi:hypothetical protein
MTKIKIKCKKKEAAEHITAIKQVFNIKEIHRSSNPITKDVKLFIKAEIKVVYNK